MLLDLNLLCEEDKFERKKKERYRRVVINKREKRITGVENKKKEKEERVRERKLRERE